jgi:hypothetical protein
MSRPPSSRSLAVSDRITLAPQLSIHVTLRRGRGLAGEPVRVGVMVGGEAVVGHQAAVRSGIPAEVMAPLSVGGVSASHWWRWAAVNSATVISGGCTQASDQTQAARGVRFPWWMRPQT